MMTITDLPQVLRADVEELVATVCGRIAPVWPLETFVAVNPYFGLADHHFADAAALLASTAGAQSTLPVDFYLDAVDHGRITDADLAAALAASRHASTSDPAEFLRQVRNQADAAISHVRSVPTVASVASALTGRDWDRLTTERVSAWASAYFDEGQATWRSTVARQPLFHAWKDEAHIDRTPEIMGLKGFRAAMRALPDSAAETTAHALEVLQISPDSAEQYLHTVLLRVGGWSAHAARLVFERSLRGEVDNTLAEFLAVLLSWELGIFESLKSSGVQEAWYGAQQSELGPDLTHRLILQDAFDRSEQHRLIDALAANRPEAAASPDELRAQAVFCIDVRSEVFRRHVEAVATGIDTIGFAGFFGFPIEFVPLAHDHGEAQVPVLLTPGFTIRETVSDPARHDEAVERRRLAHHVARSWKSFKMGAISCFSFVGPVGLLYLPKLFTDAFGKTRPLPSAETEGLSEWAANHKMPTITTNQDGTGSTGIDLDGRVALAEGALRGMSLTDGFAPVVLIVGHGATTTNNPYDNGLDCGACGGHTGEANARVAAAVLNDPAVRHELANRGIAVPATTWFIAAQHDTTTDTVTIFDRSQVPTTHVALLEELEGDLAAAGRLARAERAGRLGLQPNEDVDAAVIGRSTDWAQVRPEWGLAGCRAFIAAPRHRTRDLDLAGQSFLHSYDWRNDTTFGVLELIMSAPMVVASWINLQYYASTVDNELFGSGNKTLHNIVGRIGVLEGNAGDLRVGLPWQSVHDGTEFQHEPLRLNVIIEAPIEAMNDVIAAHPHVGHLCDNEWIRLCAMGDEGTITHRYTGGLTWEPVPTTNTKETSR